MTTQEWSEGAWRVSQGIIPKGTAVVIGYAPLCEGCDDSECRCQRRSSAREFARGGDD